MFNKFQTPMKFGAKDVVESIKPWKYKTREEVQKIVDMAVEDWYSPWQVIKDLRERGFVLEWYVKARNEFLGERQSKIKRERKKKTFFWSLMEWISGAWELTTEWAAKTWVWAGATKSIVSLPWDVTSAVWLGETEVWEFLTRLPEEFDKKIQENWLNETTVNVSEFAWDLGLSVGATKALLWWIKSIPALKQFATRFPTLTKYMKLWGEWALWVQTFKVAQEGELATPKETLVGAGINAVVGRLLQWFQSIKPPTKSSQKAASQIVWLSKSKAKKADIPKIINAIQDEVFSPEKIDDYAWLATKSDEAAKTIYQAQKTYLSQFDDIVDDAQRLVTLSDDTGTKVNVDYVTRALDQLETIASSRWDDLLLAKVQNFKSNLPQLKISDINDIAIEFWNNVKSFSTATGQPLTSVTAEAAETTRKWLKKTLRQLLPDDTSKVLDERYSNMASLRFYAKNMEEAIFDLQKKINEKWVWAQIVDKIDDLASDVTWWARTEIRSRLAVWSWRWKKTLNALDIEELLPENINIIKKLWGLVDWVDEQSIRQWISNIAKETGLSASWLAKLLQNIITRKWTDILVRD